MFPIYKLKNPADVAALNKFMEYVQIERVDGTEKELFNDVMARCQNSPGFAIIFGAICFAAIDAEQAPPTLLDALVAAVESNHSFE